MASSDTMRNRRMVLNFAGASGTPKKPFVQSNRGVVISSLRKPNAASEAPKSK